jgi:DNA-directed RNA polymerase specialized sigma24 family protein
MGSTDWHYPMLPDDPETQTPPPKAEWFTATHWSVVLAAGQSGSPQAAEALDKLCRTYWYPLYAFVRRQGHGPHDAQDLTQGFFARFLERNYLEAVDREKGKFRSFLLKALNHFLGDERDRANAAKRGGGRVPIPLDEAAAETLYLQDQASNASPETLFEQRWAITLLEQAFSRLREEFALAGKADYFDQIKGFLAEGANSGDYALVAAPLQMTAGAVAVAVHRLRQRYGELVRAEVANTVAAPDEIENEMRHLFAVINR